MHHIFCVVSIKLFSRILNLSNAQSYFIKTILLIPFFNEVKFNQNQLFKEI